MGFIEKDKKLDGPLDWLINSADRVFAYYQTIG